MPAFIPKEHIVNIPASVIDEIKNIYGDQIVVREYTAFYIVDVVPEKGMTFDDQGVVFDKELFLNKVKLRLAIEEMGLNSDAVSTIVKNRGYPEPVEVDLPGKYTIEEIIRALSLHSIKLDPNGLVQALHMARKRITLDNQLTSLVNYTTPFKEGNE